MKMSNLTSIKSALLKKARKKEMQKPPCPSKPSPGALLGPEVILSTCANHQTAAVTGTVTSVPRSPKLQPGSGPLRLPPHPTTESLTLREQKILPCQEGGRPFTTRATARSTTSHLTTVLGPAAQKKRSLDGGILSTGRVRPDETADLQTCDWAVS